MDLSGINILLVEDNEADALIISSFIETVIPGANIVTATSLVQTAEVIENFNGHRFVVIILDLHLPDSNGLDTLRS